MGRRLAELRGWALPCSTPIASLPTFSGAERLQARAGMGEEPRCVQGRNMLSPAALLTQSLVVEQENKVHL